ncbi:MAG TPA: hypothetical protein VEC11_05615 [Allosphingosinicella sp.]|nr:hypothetical protein [Allosphingosinicella sp.]
MNKARLICAFSAFGLWGCGGQATNNNLAEVHRGPEQSSNAGSAARDCSRVARADQNPQNDILGVDLGMSADDAHRVLSCAEGNYTVEFTSGGFSTARTANGPAPRGLLRASRGDDEQVLVYLAGMPGQERVVGLARRVRFPTGSEPATDQLTQSIRAKYGALSPRTTAPGYQILAAAFSPEGQQLAPDSFELSSCTGPQLDGAHGGINQISEGCGMTVLFHTSPARSNPNLVGEFKLRVIDQRAAVTALNAIESNARRMQEQQQELDTERARSENRTPEL